MRLGLADFLTPYGIVVASGFYHLGMAPSLGHLSPLGREDPIGMQYG